MNWLDIIIIVAILGFVLSAYGAGLIREIVTLLAIILGIVLAGLLYNDLAADVLVFIDNDEAAQAISFLILLGAVYLLGQIIAYLLKRTASILMLGWADHMGGALFGLLKGFFAVEVLLIVFSAYPQLHLDDAVDDSSLAPFFLENAPVVLHILPGEFKERVDQFLSPSSARMISFRNI